MAKIKIPDWLKPLLVTNPSIYNEVIIVRCPICKNERSIKYRSIRISKNHGVCISCSAKRSMTSFMANEHNRYKISERSKKNWESSDYRNKIVKSCRESSKEKWKDPKFRANVLNGISRGLKIDDNIDKWIVSDKPELNTDDIQIECPRCHIIRSAMYKSIQNWNSALCTWCARLKVSDITKYDRFLLAKKSPNVDWDRTTTEFGYDEQILSGDKIWHVCSYCGQTTLTNALKLQSNNYDSCASCSRKKMFNKTSSLQSDLYDILDDLDCNYSKEPDDISKIVGTHPNLVGGYWFDCRIFVANKPDILIETHGNYWHDYDLFPEKKIADDFKSYLIADNPEFDLKIIWEHEFKCQNRVLELIKYWTNNNINMVNFEFHDVKIDKISTDDAKSFLNRYHYIGTVGHNAIKYGAFFKDRLIAVSTFGPVTRKETATKLELNPNQVCEYTRLCIHPKYQKKNLATWFMSRCIKKLKDDRKKCKIVVSFADTTFNHDGTVYKAGNWIFDGEVKSSYWYVDRDGYVMHKKTLYNHACSMRMKEKAYANKFNYRKVHGKKKLRFLYYLNRK